MTHTHPENFDTDDITGLDLAAILCAAMSLRQSLEDYLDDGISDEFEGADNGYRYCMERAIQFERWACDNIEFAEMEDVWPYWLEEHFGPLFVRYAWNTDLDAIDWREFATRARLPVREPNGTASHTAPAQPQHTESHELVIHNIRIH